MSTHGTEHEYAAGLDESTWRTLPDNERCECDDCGWRGDVAGLNSIHHVHERIAESEIMSAGECPECAALVCTAAGEAEIERQHKAQRASRALLSALKYTLAYAVQLEQSAGLANPRNTSLSIPRKAIAEAEAVGIEPTSN